MLNQLTQLLRVCLLLLAPLGIQSQTLPTPVHVAPSNGATGQPTTVTIRWKATPGANQYKVAVGTTPVAQGTIVWDTTYTDTFRVIPNLAAGDYYWRIKAKKTSPYQSSVWSTVWKFTVGTPSGGGGGGGGTTTLVAPTLQTPSNNATLQVLGTNFVWNAVSGATFYKIKVATDVAMANVIFQDNNVATTSCFAQNLNFNTPYFWTVQAANATSTGPVSGVRTFTTMPDNPNAVTAHPRLLITQADLPNLQAWAVPSNPVFVALQNTLNSAISTYNSKFYPGGVQNPVWPDLGNTTWSGYVTEQYAEFFAFWSLMDPVVANRPVHAQRARNLLMYVIDQALLGPAAGVPFRDPQFMTYDRSRVYGEACPLTVDWIYNAKDANNNDILTAADKTKIRTVFLRWCGEQVLAWNHPTPIGLVNDKQISLTNRWILNNYYSGHARNLTFMALSMDAADDAPINPNLHYSALGNSVRSYIHNATGAWLYQQYAQYEKPEIVAADYGVPTGGLGMGSGGLSVESSLYGSSIGWVAQQVLALKTAGWSDEAIIGKQAKLLTSDFWTRVMDGMLHSIAPAPYVPAQAPYYGQIYWVANYGDLLRSWMTPEGLQITAPVGLIDMKLGNNQSRLDKTRWFSRNAIQGGAGLLAQRITNVWPNSLATNAIYYYLLLPPGVSNPPDPRPAMSTAFWDPAFKKLLARTEWTNNCSWFNWQCHWMTINHQSGDNNQFEFYRKGEWLTKERSGYTNDGVGYTSEFHNTLALQNNVPSNMQWFEGPTSQRGGQWTNGLCSGDPSVITSTSNDFVYATGDATNLYNRGPSASDIAFASRSIVWLKPDHIVVYDRAKSLTANRFKRFFLQFTGMPSVAGKDATVTTPGGQKVFLSNLLPAASVLTAFPTENINATAELEIANFELKIEDPANPQDVRFLNVIQGADGNGAKDAAALVQSTNGTAFEGVAVKNIAVLFPSLWNTAFTSTTYTTATAITRHIVTGLTPNAGYNVTLTPNGGNVTITIEPGNQLTADAGGVLSFVLSNLANGSAGDRSVDVFNQEGKSLFEVAPNPFSGNATIRYALNEPKNVTLELFDLTGRKVQTLVNGELQPEGLYEVRCSADGLSAGTYLCKLTRGTVQEHLVLVVHK